MSTPAAIRSLGELQRSPGFDWERLRRRTVKDELRENLLAGLKRGKPLFPGIVGYDDTVIPQLTNAILSRHNFILLGLRGQAKSRILRELTRWLDAEMPSVAGCPIHDNPAAPLCPRCRQLLAEAGDETPIEMLAPEQRYVEKLATPDVTIADLIGDVDPIRAARGGMALDNELTIHYGLVPRAHRGIFALNELPDLASKIQVGLFNILQEGDVQIKGYPIRLRLDLMMAFSANPEDYTARGKIITPLKDRIGSEIRTHYPATLEEGIAITEQEADLDRTGLRVQVPRFVREVVEGIAFAARQDKRVDKRSGVSQRLPITCLENAVSNAERRSILTGEREVVVRIGDVYRALPALTGKLELEYEGEMRGADLIAHELIRTAIGQTFDLYFADADLQKIVQWFELGGTLQIDEESGADRTWITLNQIQGLAGQLTPLQLPSNASSGWKVAAAEFLLEGLCAHRRISRSEELGYYKEEKRPSGSENQSWHEPPRNRPPPSAELRAAMRSIYRRYIPGELSDLQLQDLVHALADYLLQSGYQDPYSRWFEAGDMEQTMKALQEAIRRVLEESNLLDEAQRKAIENATPEQWQALLQQLTERLEQEGYISVDTPPEQPSALSPGRVGKPAQVRFEITDKALDFLGYRTLKDLLAGLGKSSFGRHDTRDFATGVECSGSSRAWEFGDMLNLDISETIGNVLKREGLIFPMPLESRDLVVHQSEYQSSCATVLLLDCSHSMILYGEDRFTPAKKVALALAHLLRTQYPGDSLQVVLFHDFAEELPLSQLARAQVGPYYTNTREGLRLAQRLLQRQRKDMKQIVMITDGKPSALTLEDGRIYKNAFGLDPLVVSQTLEEVARCRRSNILINTFMLASDFGLMQFVQKVTEICRGKAYFTTPCNLGEYLLMDYMNRKSKMIH